MGATRSHGVGSCANLCGGNVVVRSLTTRVNDVIQPTVDGLTLLDSNISQSLPVLDTGLHRIASGLEFIREGLAKLDQPVSLAGDPFIQLNNTESVTSARYSSLGLDFKLPASGPPFR